MDACSPQMYAMKFIYLRLRSKQKIAKYNKLPLKWIRIFHTIGRFLSLQLESRGHAWGNRICRWTCTAVGKHHNLWFTNQRECLCM